MARVLIVEDETILAMKTEKDLQDMGHEVVGTVQNGAEAIELARSPWPMIAG